MSRFIRIVLYVAVAGLFWDACGNAYAWAMGLPVEAGHSVWLWAVIGPVLLASDLAEGWYREAPRPDFPPAEHSR